MCAGGATTTVYPSTNAEDTAYILSDSECQVVFAEDDEQIEKLTEQPRRAARPSPRSSPSTAPRDGDWIITLDALADLGEKYLVEHPDAITDDGRGDRARPARHADLHLRHHRPPQGRAAARTSPGSTRARRSRVQDILDEDDLQFLWLPMAHSFGKVLLSAQLACGFATAIDGRVDKIVDNLGVVKPTFMGAAPRIFEKAHGRIITMQAGRGRR